MGPAAKAFEQKSDGRFSALAAVGDPCFLFFSACESAFVVKGGVH